MPQRGKMTGLETDGCAGKIFVDQHFHGLELAKHNGWSNVIMETDAEVVVKKQILGPNARTDWSCANVVAAVKHLARSTWNVVRPNRCANWLALQARRKVCPVNKNGEQDSVLDKLSCLPKDAIDQILRRLPLRDAVRTSVLSSKWRFNWTSIPALVFDQECLSPIPQDQPMKLVNFIDQALLLHTGPIYAFKVDQRDPIPISKTDIDRWIVHLSKCPVLQVLVLEIWEGQSIQLHSCISCFQDLVFLSLYRCHLKLPSTFGGFKKMAHLFLFAVTADVFESLISSCPKLKELRLYYIHGLTQLNIDAPNLWEFAFKGYFEDINLINSSNLAVVSINLIIADDAPKRFKARYFSNLLKFFSNLPRIKRLVINGRFLEYLAIGDIPTQLPNPCLDLGYLNINIYFGDCAEISAALCLLRSSPNVQKLDICVRVIPSREEEEFTMWESKAKNCSFNKLERVEIDAFSGSKNELEFIQFMLLASPALQKMTIKPTSKNQALQLERELLRFQGASTKVEVLWSFSSPQPNND